MSSFQSDCIVQQGVYAFYTRFRVPKLYRYVHEGKWHKIPSRCKSHSHEAKFVHRYPPCDTTLHRLICALDSPSTGEEQSEQQQFLIDKINQLRLDAVLALIQANPSIVSSIDSFGQTPLHLACMHHAEYTKRIVEVLFDAYPMAAVVEDMAGKTPLHHLLSRCQHVSSELIDKFIAVGIKATEVMDKRDCMTFENDKKLSASLDGCFASMLESDTTSALQR